MTLLDFMSNHPILTVILTLIGGIVIVKSIAAARGYYNHCDGCACLEPEDNN